MGKSDDLVKSFYNSFNVQSNGKTALLGFSNNNWYSGDLYDLKLNNWDINSDWKLPQKYDTIICTRCAYFAKDPHVFLDKCLAHLEETGTIFVDWGLGDHFRVSPYMVGFVKDNVHASCYSPTNYLWSTVWEKNLENHPQVQVFKKWIEPFGYHGSLYDHVKKEVPSILDLNSLENVEIDIDALCIWEQSPQLYILLSIKHAK